MKNLLICFVVFILLSSCKDCVECRYSTLKGVERQTLCSSIKEDRIAFEVEWDSLARYAGSEVICTKESF